MARQRKSASATSSGLTRRFVNIPCQLHRRCQSQVTTIDRVECFQNAKGLIADPGEESYVGNHKKYPPRATNNERIEWDSRINTANLSVEVNEGVATLTGAV